MKWLERSQVHLWSRLLCLAVSAASLWLIFRWVDFSVLVKALYQLRPGWFIAAFLLFGFDCLLAAWRWHLMLRLVKCTVHPAATVRMVFIGHFFNTFLLGPAGGDFAKSAVYSRWFGFRVPEILASSFLDRILGGGGQLLFVLITLALAAFAGVFAESRQLALAEKPFWILVVLAAVFLVSCFFTRRRLSRNSPMAKTMNAFLDGFQQLIRAPKLAVGGLAVSFWVQVALSGVLAICLQAVSQEPLPWPKLLWTFPIISLVSSVPITVAGAGLREGAALVLLGFSGISPSDAVAASLLALIVYLAWAAIGGFLLAYEKRLRTLRRPHELGNISVVIPVYNEEAALPETLRRIKTAPEISEIVVVDGGSEDRTIGVAREHGCRIVHAPKSRGAQMRAGAEAASNPIILLLHADTWLPPQAGQAVLRALRDPTIVGGGFWKEFDQPNFLMAGSWWRCAFRLVLAGRIAGDQGIFVRRDILQQVGGVPNMPLMEEFELCRRLRAKGRLALAGATVITSSRRFFKRGVLRTYARMWRLTLQYYCGASTKRLEEIYERD